MSFRSPYPSLVRDAALLRRSCVVLVLLLLVSCGGRKAPTSLPHPTSHSERGIASWYGSKFHGRQTANGETYDMHALTAAHRTLPFGTWLEVTNLENGRRVTVRVNDRGPFKKGRIIDLSYAAARELRMVESGVVEVRIRTVGSPGLRRRGTRDAGPFKPFVDPRHLGK